MHYTIDTPGREHGGFVVAQLGVYLTAGETNKFCLNLFMILLSQSSSTSPLW
jgi:hypothetical protein